MRYVNISTGTTHYIADIRRAHPGVSIPNDADCSALGYAFLTQSPAPTLAANQTAREASPALIDGEWVQQWEVIDVDPVIPQRVTALQGMLAIKAAGLVPAFVAWRAGLDPVDDFEIIAFFDKAETWDYDNAVLDDALVDLGVAEQKPALFILAATL